VIISAGLVIGATVRGGHIVSEPEDESVSDPEEMMPSLLLENGKE
jgi:hypothetical protein